MPSQKSEMGVEGAAVRNKVDEATSKSSPRLVVRLSRLTRGTTAQREKEKLRYANGKRATNQGAKVPGIKTKRVAQRTTVPGTRYRRSKYPAVRRGGESSKDHPGLGMIDISSL